MKLPVISKTTLNGVIAFFIAAVPIVQTYPQLGIPSYVMAWLSLVAGLCRLWVGISQVDSDRILAKVPGSSEPEVVSGKPIIIPDDPKNKPILP